jgi:hypothetical protein
MWRRHKKLARLNEELGNIQAFDRVHEYATDSDPADDHAYQLRQIRRSQIVAEIKKLTASRLRYWSPTRISGAVLLVCAVAYAIFQFLRR